GLRVTAVVGGANLQQVLAGRIRNGPRKFPEPPRVFYGFAKQRRLCKRLAVVGANFDFGNARRAGPSRTEDTIRGAFRNDLGKRWLSNLRLHLLLGERHSHWIAVPMLPVGIVNRLEKPVIRLRCRHDATEPLHRRHTEPARNDRTKWKAV